MYEFKYHRPATLQQAVNLLAESEDAMLIGFLGMAAQDRGGGVIAIEAHGSTIPLTCSALRFQLSTFS